MAAHNHTGPTGSEEKVDVGDMDRGPRSRRGEKGDPRSRAISISWIWIWMEMEMENVSCFILYSAEALHPSAKLLGTIERLLVESGAWRSKGPTHTPTTPLTQALALAYSSSSSLGVLCRRRAARRFQSPISDWSPPPADSTVCALGHQSESDPPCPRRPRPRPAAAPLPPPAAPPFSPAPK